MEEQEGKPHAANAYQVFVFLMSTNISLAKASLLAKFMVKERGSKFYPLWEEAGNEYLLNNNYSIHCTSRREKVGMFKERPECLKYIQTHGENVQRGRQRLTLESIGHSQEFFLSTIGNI